MNSLGNNNKPNEKEQGSLLCEKKKKIKKSICRSKSIKGSKIIKLMEKKIR